MYEKNDGAKSDVEKRMENKKSGETSRAVSKGAMSDRDMRMMKKESSRKNRR